MTNEIKNINYGAGFIPHRLEIEARPELNDFPLNILFANFFVESGVKKIASALYVPDIDTFYSEEDKNSLLYRNSYGFENTVTIIKTPQRWEGIKRIKEENVLYASGTDWQSFFFHLTFQGLCKGERCRFESLEDLQKLN